MVRNENGNSVPVLPNFFIVGTGKAGTTSLYHYLRQHPQIYMSSIKEPCYFSPEVREENLAEAHLRHIRRRPRGWLVADWENYVQLFRDVKTETAIGEASVVYLWSEMAAANIAARIPDAKIIMILRDPAERAFSQYLHQMTGGFASSTFREHIEMCMRNRDRRISVYYPLLEVGLYYEQVQRYLERFPRHNIRIYWYEEAWQQPESLFADLFQLLNVDSAFRPDTSRKSLEGRAPRFPNFNRFAKYFDIAHQLTEIMPDGLRLPIRGFLFRDRRVLMMDPKDRQYLIDYYREDIAKLAALLDRDLGAWLTR